MLMTSVLLRNGPRPAGLEEVFEVFQTDKRAKNTRLVVELLKCNYDVRQCQIRKDESVNDRGQRKQVQKLVCPQLFKRIHSLLADINKADALLMFAIISPNNVSLLYNIRKSFVHLCTAAHIT